MEMEDLIIVTENSAAGSSESEIEANRHRNRGCQSVEINLVGHCIFCVKKIATAEELITGKNGRPDAKGEASTDGGDGESQGQGQDRVLKAAVSPDFLTTFHRIWPLVRKPFWDLKRHHNNKSEEIGRGCPNPEEKGGVDYCFKSVLYGACFGGSNEWATSFSGLPPICQVCVDKILNVEGLLNAVKQQLRELWMITVASANNERRLNRFERQLRDARIGSTVILSTLQFLMMSDENSSRIEEDAGEVKEEVDEYIQEPNLVKMEVDEEIREEYTDQESSDQEEDEEDEEPEMEISDGQDNDDDYIADPMDAKSDDEEDDDEETEEEEEEEDEDEETLKKSKKRQSQSINKTMTKKRRNIKPGNSRSCTCEICGAILSRKLYLNSHYAKVHPDFERNVCDMCGNRVPMAQMLKHVQKHVGDYAQKCHSAPKCKFVASSQEALKSHYKFNGPCKQASTFSCDANGCDYKTEREAYFRNHLLNVHEKNFEPRSEDDGFKCPITNCLKRFGTRQSVWFHLETHNYSDSESNAKPAQTQKCGHCQKSIEVGQKTENHLRFCHDAKEIIKCEQCPYQFFSRVDLLGHMFVHRHNGMYCDICKNGVKFTRHHDLRKHYSTLHQIEVKLFVCEICNSAFRRKSNLGCHKREKHSALCSNQGSSTSTSKKKRYPCDLCTDPPRDFAHEVSLDAHKVLVHGAKPLVCKTCGKSFSSRVKFKRHEKEHAGLVLPSQFKCDVEGCGQVFKYGTRLRYHKIMIHEIGDKHVCEECGKGFPSQSLVKAHHDRNHLKLKRNVCEDCGHGFYEKKHLDVHRIRVHPKEDDKPKLEKIKLEAKKTKLKAKEKRKKK